MTLVWDDQTPPFDYNLSQGMTIRLTTPTHRGRLCDGGSALKPSLCHINSSDYAWLVMLLEWFDCLQPCTLHVIPVGVVARCILLFLIIAENMSGLTIKFFFPFFLFKRLAIYNSKMQCEALNWRPEYLSLSSMLAPGFTHSCPEGGSLNR